MSHYLDYFSLVSFDQCLLANSPCRWALFILFEACIGKPERERERGEMEKDPRVSFLFPTVQGLSCFPVRRIGRDERPEIFDKRWCRHWLRLRWDAATFVSSGGEKALFCIELSGSKRSLFFLHAFSTSISLAFQTAWHYRRLLFRSRSTGISLSLWRKISRCRCAWMPT